MASPSVQVWLALKWPDEDAENEQALAHYRGGRKDVARGDTVRPGEMLDFCLVEENRDGDLCLFR